MLFIDEIHRLNPAVEEILYPAMEDFQLDLIIGEGPAAASSSSIALEIDSNTDGSSFLSLTFVSSNASPSSCIAF